MCMPQAFQLVACFCRSNVDKQSSASRRTDNALLCFKMTLHSVLLSAEIFAGL